MISDINSVIFVTWLFPNIAYIHQKTLSHPVPHPDKGSVYRFAGCRTLKTTFLFKGPICLYGGCIVYIISLYICELKGAIRCE